MVFIRAIRGARHSVCCVSVLHAYQGIIWSTLSTVAKWLRRHVRHHRHLRQGYLRLSTGTSGFCGNSTSTDRTKFRCCELISPTSSRSVRPERVVRFKPLASRLLLQRSPKQSLLGSCPLPVPVEVCATDSTRHCTRHGNHKWPSLWLVALSSMPVSAS